MKLPFTQILVRISTICFLALAAFTGLAAFNEVHAAASLYMAASSTRVYPGATVTVYPRVNTGGANTNAYNLNIVFSGPITPIGISKGGSICTLYTAEPSYSASTASISCGLPTPGYNGTAGGLGSISFRATAIGTATVTITGSSQVLANDGVGTNILGSTGASRSTSSNLLPRRSDSRRSPVNQERMERGYRQTR